MDLRLISARNLGTASLLAGGCKCVEAITSRHMEKLRLRIKPVTGDRKVRLALFQGGDFSKELREAGKEKKSPDNGGPDELIQEER